MKVTYKEAHTKLKDINQLAAIIKYDNSAPHKNVVHWSIYRAVKSINKALEGMNNLLLDEVRGIEVAHCSVTESEPHNLILDDKGRFTFTTEKFIEKEKKIKVLEEKFGNKVVEFETYPVDIAVLGELKIPYDFIVELDGYIFTGINEPTKTEENNDSSEDNGTVED